MKIQINQGTCFTRLTLGIIWVLNTLQTSALFISSNTFDVSLLVIGRSIPKYPT